LKKTGDHYAAVVTERRNARGPLEIYNCLFSPDTSDFVGGVPLPGIRSGPRAHESQDQAGGKPR